MQRCSTTFFAIEAHCSLLTSARKSDAVPRSPFLLRRTRSRGLHHPVVLRRKHLNLLPRVAPLAPRLALLPPRLALLGFLLLEPSGGSAGRAAGNAGLHDAGNVEQLPKSPDPLLRVGAEGNDGLFAFLEERVVFREDGVAAEEALELRMTVADGDADVVEDQVARPVGRALRVFDRVSARARISLESERERQEDRSSKMINRQRTESVCRASSPGSVLQRHQAISVQSWECSLAKRDARPQRISSQLLKTPFVWLLVDSDGESRSAKSTGWEREVAHCQA